MLNWQTPPDPNPKPDPKPTPDDGDNDSAEKKLVIYHEIDNKKKDAGKFKSEILVKHQYQMKQASDDLKFKQKDLLTKDQENKTLDKGFNVTKTEVLE